MPVKKPASSKKPYRFGADPSKKGAPKKRPVYTDRGELNKKPEGDWILIHILRWKDWAPLSRTHKLDRLLEILNPDQEAELFNQFSRFILFLYKRDIRKQVETQYFRHSAPYPEHSEKWAEYKRRNNLNPGFWIATGELMEGLQFWKDTDGSYHIGFRMGVTNSKGREFLMIANVLERGSVKRNIPPRPLFGPTASYISRHIVDFFVKFLKKNHPHLVKYV